MRTGAADFWRFFARREEARRRHELRLGPPYSNDPWLARFHFCNVFREADTGTKFFHANRAGAGTFLGDVVGREPTDGGWLSTVLWQAYCYRPVNRVATFERFRAEGPRGTTFPRFGEARHFITFLRRVVADGDRAYTGRHLVRGTGNLAQSLYWLQRSNHLDAVVAAVAEAPSMKAVTDAVRRAPYVGEFFSWQIACDLNEAGLLGHVPDKDTWALLGPGAQRGASLISATQPALHVALDLVETQRYYLDFDNGRVAPDDSPIPAGSFFRTPIVVKDIEHALCEYVRYDAARNGKASLEVKPWAKTR